MGAADKKAIVLVSGGLDSATVLAAARARGFACYAISFDYGQRHRAELVAADRVSRLLGAVQHRVVPIDLSAFYTRRPEVVRAAFSLVPDYLRTPEDGLAPNLMDYGVSLGRRFRALKLWMVLRAFGREGIVERLRDHMRLAHLFRGWVDEDPHFEAMAPTPLSVVCFRALFPGEDAAGHDRLNDEMVEAANATGEIFVAPTKLRGRTAIRLAVGNIRTEERHVRRAWELLREAAAARRT